MNSADVHNIGTPRAFGHALGLRGARYSNPYPFGSDAHKAYTSGYHEGAEERLYGPFILSPDVPESDNPSIA